MRTPTTAGGSPAVVGVLAAGSFNHSAEGPVDSLDHPAGEGPRPASGVEGGEDLVPDAARLVYGHDGVEVAPQPVPGLRQHHQQVGPVPVELGVFVQVGVLPRVLPAVAALLLAAPDPVHGAYPVAGVGVPDGVEEALDLPVEEGPGDELAAALALDEVPVGVDQGQLVRRGLGQGDVACGDCQERRQEQRGCQGNQPSNGPEFRSQRQLRSPLFCGLPPMAGLRRSQKSVTK